jgi:ankyrin repeat protein
LKGGETPLMKAIIFGQINCIKILLRFGADLSVENQVNKIY